MRVLDCSTKVQDFFCAQEINAERHPDAEEDHAAPPQKLIDRALVPQSRAREGGGQRGGRQQDSVRGA